MQFPVEAICVGKPVPFNGAEKSAFAKHPVETSRRITVDGVEGDEQADRKHHGGPQMAVHLYPLDHHDFWTGALMGHELLEQPGAFGSNLAVRGIDETQVCIGDRFRLGSALIEISQPRQPCWKIEHRFQRKGMVATIIETARCGWYFRVIKEGEAQADDPLERVEQVHDGWTVERVFKGIFQRATSREELEGISALDRLSPQHRERALRRVSKA